MNKDLIIEAVGGYFAIYGIGWIKTGHVVEGLILMVGYWVSALLAVGLMMFVYILTLGLGSCVVLPVAGIIYLSLPIYSAYRLNLRLQADYEERHYGIKRKTFF